MQGAIVMIQIVSNVDLSELHKLLHAVANVKEVYFLTGSTDVICHVEAADADEVVSTVMKLRGVMGVASTDTRIILPIH